MSAQTNADHRDTETRRYSNNERADCERRSGRRRRPEALCVSVSRWSILVCALSPLTLFAQQPPVPQPFPRPGSPPPPVTQPAPRPSQPAAQPAAPEATPTEATLGVPIYPGSQFLASYDAGRGQRYYIFGSAAPFVDVVVYYRAALKQKGELVYDTPATHEFDVGKYNEDTMAFPPGVTVKDYQSEVSQGYPNPKPGGAPARFPTVIQIVPATVR